ncbi:MAG TPA: hypothetical protein VMW38_08780 [Terriglobia bacterium]|nr:hypothetical protein [Terriglobia bacterium]
MVLILRMGERFHENGLNGHKKIVQGTAGEKREPAGEVPAGTAARHALGIGFRNRTQLLDQARADSPRLIEE